MNWQNYLGIATLSATASFGIIKLIIQTEAEKALNPVFESLNKRLDKLESDKQSKENCLIHHSSLDQRLVNIENMLKSLIDLHTHSDNDIRSKI